MQFHGTRFSPLFLCFIIAAFALLTPAISSAQNAEPDSRSGPSAEFKLYFPLISHNQPPSLIINSMITTDDIGQPQQAFLSGDMFNHQVSGTTVGSLPITATLQIHQTGPCGSGLVFSDTLTLPAGGWAQAIPALAPGCTGVFTTTAALSYELVTIARSANFVVNDPFSQIYYDGHGFDRCAPADPADMQTWWDQSPYKVVNIYLGGVHYACSNDTLDAFWVREVAEQGWDFTAIWVGPQSPCSNYSYRISADPAAAYGEGKLEAILAADRARELGLFGDLTLHYDLESYSNGTTSCRAAVQSFMRGWTDQLHLLGHQAGAYGSACSSYIGDWWNNNPTLDQIWIAHWIHSSYNPSATVWGALCISDSLWPNQQRLRQYAGGHNETWGGVTMPIDSNVFETTAVGWGSPSVSSQPVLDFAMLDQASGWVLAGSKVLRTTDAGAAWEDITPPGFEALGAGFADRSNGWLVGWMDGSQGLAAARTQDGGLSWRFTMLGPDAADDLPVAAAFVEALDAQHVWIALKIQSGINFSIGQLLASQDGGNTWELRSHPLGEPVHFTDEQNGWTAGGPNGDSFYRTVDGGRTWQEAAGSLPQGFTGPLPAGTAGVQAFDGVHAWTLIQESACTGPKDAPVCVQHWRIAATTNGGRTWTTILSDSD